MKSLVEVCLFMSAQIQYASDVSPPSQPNMYIIEILCTPTHRRVAPSFYCGRPTCPLARESEPASAPPTPCLAEGTITALLSPSHIFYRIRSISASCAIFISDILEASSLWNLANISALIPWRCSA